MVVMKMEEYSGLTDCMKLMLDKAEELDWSCTVYIEPTQKNRTYVEMSKFSPAGEDFGMIIDFDRTRQWTTSLTWRSSKRELKCGYKIRSDVTA